MSKWKNIKVVNWKKAKYESLFKKLCHISCLQYAITSIFNNKPNLLLIDETLFILTSRFKLAKSWLIKKNILYLKIFGISTICNSSLIFIFICIYIYFMAKNIFVANE